MSSLAIARFHGACQIKSCCAHITFHCARAHSLQLRVVVSGVCFSLVTAWLVNCQWVCRQAAISAKHSRGGCHTPLRCGDAPGGMSSGMPASHIHTTLTHTQFVVVVQKLFLITNWVWVGASLRHDITYAILAQVVVQSLESLGPRLRGLTFASLPPFS